MKLKVDIGDPLEIPDAFLKKFYDSLAPEEKQEVKDEQTFQDMFEHFMWELLEEYEGKIAPKEIAKLIIMWYVHTVLSEGGYPVYNDLELQIGNDKYVVAVFAWTCFLDEKEEPYMVAYKE